MSVTQKELAEKLNISRSLVARALKGYEEVSPATRQLVEAAAAEHGYRPHRAAQALVTGRTHQIALCVPTMDNRFHAEFVRRFVAFARQTDYDLLVTTTLERKHSMAQLSVDGVLLHHLNPQLVQQITCPAVLLQSPPMPQAIAGKAIYDQVELGLAQASHAAMQHLLEQKPQRVAYVSFSGNMAPGEPRYAAYLHAMKQAKLKVEVVALDYVDGDELRSITHRTLQEYAQTNGWPDALFCHNDEIAIGVYRALRAAGRNVPGQTLVIGCDDISETEELFPALTTIRHPWEEICHSAWGMLMSRLENPTQPARKSTFQGELVIRDSSCRNN